MRSIIFSTEIFAQKEEELPDLSGGPAHKSRGKKTKQKKNDPPHLSKKATTQHGSCGEIPNKQEMQ